MRVFKHVSAIAQVAEPLGIAAGGWAVELFGFTPTVALFGFTPTVATLGVAALGTALSCARLPGLRQMERPVE